MEMELADLAGKERAQSLLQPSGYHSVKMYYQSVCDAQRRASQRNTGLLADLSSLRRRLQLAKDNASNHLTRFTSLKCHYEAYVVSVHKEWVKLTAQQTSATSHLHGDDRQPDSLITADGPEGPYPSTSGHTSIHPSSTPMASSTSLEPRPLASLEAATSDQTTLHTAKQTLLSQHNDDITPKAPTSVAELGSRVPIHSESKPGTSLDQGKPVEMKDNDLRQDLTKRETVVVGERISMTTMDKDGVTQGPTVDEGGSKTDSLSTSKEEVGKSVTQTGGDRSERGVELPHPHSTDPIEELGLSTLSPSPSPSHSVDLSPTISTHNSLNIQRDKIIIPASVGEQLSIDQDGLLTEDLSASHDDLSVENVPVSERAAESPGIKEEEGRGMEGYAMPDTSKTKEKSLGASTPQPTPVRDSSLYQQPRTNTTVESAAAATALQSSPSWNNVTASSTQPSKENIPTSQQDNESILTAEQGMDNVAASQQDKEAVSSSLSVVSSKQAVSPSLSASQERDHHQVSPSNDRGSLLDGLLSPTDATLSDSDDGVSVNGLEGAPAGTSSAVSGKALVTVVVNLLSTLNQHLSVDAESADLMYTLPASSDSMKGQITSSSVLAANITKMAVVGEDLSTWEPGAVSILLLQQLSHMTSSVGGLLPQQLLEEDAPLLTSSEELSSHMTQQWSAVWPLLLEHMLLLCGCGCSITELAATLTPALVASGNSARSEKACLQLISILQGKVKRTSPKDAHVEGEPLSLSEASSPQLSLKEEAVNDVEEKREESGKLEMAMTVFGEEDDDLSELLSEGSAIAEVEGELEKAVMAGHRQQHSKATGAVNKQQSSSSIPLPSFTTSPLHIHSSPGDDNDGDVSDSLADSSPLQSSPGYIPTALEQRNSVLSSHASNQSSLRRTFGLVSESESEGSGLDDYDSLHPPTMPLHNQPNNRSMEGTGGHNLKLEDYDFYD